MTGTYEKSEMNRISLLAIGLFAGAAMVAVVLNSATARAQDSFAYDAKTVDVAAHWAARSTLANAVMFSGLGEPLNLSMSQIDDLLKHAGYITRPAMPDMAIVGVLYAAGDPKFKTKPDFADPATLPWKTDTFDRTLEPAAQAWALVKITSPVFHLQYHELKDDKRAALMMLPQARTQAHVLAQRLTGEQGLLAARKPDGSFAGPRLRDQAAVLWGVSNLILAARSQRDDYWHQAYRDLIDAEDYRDLANRAFAGVQTLPPQSAADLAIAIQALGRFALAADEKPVKKKARTLAGEFASKLKQTSADPLEDAASTVYGLVEASRLLGDDGLKAAAVGTFNSKLLPLWSDEQGAFRTSKEGEFLYTPFLTGTVAAALNAMRWYGPEEASQRANALYPRFFQTVIVEAGLLQATPLPLVAEAYLQKEPPAHFAHPALPSSEETGLAPVFASEVRFEGGRWRVSDRTFRSGEAMFLANMLVKPMAGQADAFLPDEALKQAW